MAEPGSASGQTVQAAGAVIWRPGPDGPEVVLVHRPRYDDWSFPKGKRNRGEHLLTTAVREVAEETGLRVVLGRPLSPSRYLAQGRPKLVRYWAARPVASSGFVPGSEVDQISWVPAGQAAGVLTYERDVLLLNEFAAAPVDTHPLILLRHAAAGSKYPPGADDLARPLDAEGVADARRLAGLLGAFGPCRVLSSAAERCVATVRPYAEAIGVPVEIVPALTLDAELPSEAVHPDRSSTDSAPPVAGGQADVFIADLLTAAAPALICAHRENLPLLAEAARRALAGSAGLDSSALPKGAFWVLHAAGGRMFGAERHEAAG